MVQLQVKPGLFGVIKLQWRTWPSRNWLSFAVAGVFLIAAAVLVIWQHRSVAEPPQSYAILRWAVVGALVLIVVFRLLLEGTVSKPPPGTPPKWDRLLVDPRWTPIHLLTGITLGVWLVPFVVGAMVTMAWEVVEISVPGFGNEEITGNRLIDILVAWIGWLIVALIIGHLMGVSLPLI